MKETKKSLKVYFIVVGVLGTLSSIGPIALPVGALIKLVAVINLVMSVAFFYFGVKFYDYLQNSPKTLNNFVTVYFGVWAFTRLITGQWVSAALTILIGYSLVGRYMIRNVNRLSTEPAVETKK